MNNLKKCAYKDMCGKCDLPVRCLGLLEVDCEPRKSCNDLRLNKEKK